MTIIHLSSSLSGGGAEQMVLQLAKQSNAIFKTIVISVSKVNTLEEKFINNDIEVHFLNVTSFKNKSVISGLKKLHIIVKNIENAVFHCHQFHGYLIGLLYNIKYSKTPIVFTLHSSTIKNFNRKLLLYMTKSFRKKDIIFSANARKWYLGNCEIIPNGVDFSYFNSRLQRSFEKTEVFNFLFLGRLSKEKNPLFLITAAEHLINNGIKNFVINVVGDGDLSGQLEEGISVNNLDKHFNIIGFQINVKQYLVEAHCLILPSLWEGMPVVILESAALKLPVISTPVGSIPDFLNNTNAYLCSLEDFPKSMISVILNYNEAIRKSELLFNEIESAFNIENVFNQHVELYKSLAFRNN